MEQLPILMNLCSRLQKARKGNVPALVAVRGIPESTDRRRPREHTTAHRQDSQIPLASNTVYIKDDEKKTDDIREQ